MRILPRMDEEWNPMVVRLNPAEGGVSKSLGCFATKGEPNGEVICNMQVVPTFSRRV